MADSGYLPFFLSGMTIQNFTATGFRNLTDSTVGFGPGVNIFYGLNGSGKTNLLEAIMLVLLARSQRGAANDRRHGCEKLRAVRTFQCRGGGAGGHPDSGRGAIGAQAISGFVPGAV
jgi:recombinational DNA repair ATPase RecF